MKEVGIQENAGREKEREGEGETERMRRRGREREKEIRVLSEHSEIITLFKAHCLGAVSHFFSLKVASSTNLYHSQG